MRYMAQLGGRLPPEAKSRFSLLGLSTMQTQAANILLFLQLLDVRDGSIVWKGNNEARSRSRHSRRVQRFV